MAKKMAAQQRALFTFLLSTLVGPALAALAVLLASLGAALVGRIDTSGVDDRLAWAASRALMTYVAAALPAGLFGAVMAALVWQTGGFSWLAASIAGAVSATVFTMASASVTTGAATPIAFLGACVGVVIWWLAERLRLSAAATAVPKPQPRRRK